MSSRSRWRWERARGFPAWRLLLAAALILPPVWRVASPGLRRDPPAAQPAAAQEAEILKLRVELESARGEVERLRAESRSWGALALPERWELAAAEVLPVSDPSPRRRMLWALLEGGGSLPGPAAAIAVAPASGAGPAVAPEPGVLVGRALPAADALRFVRIETTLDPGFRVRFRHHGASGMLWGTGEEIDGRPVLEIKHLSELVELKEGEPVVTDGNDGVYPAGILIGVVARHVSLAAAPGAPSRPGRLYVHGAAAPESESRVLLAIDRVQESLAHLRAREEERAP